MTLNRYYRTAIFIPSVLVMVFNLVYNTILLIEDKDYKSEWFTNESFFIITIMMSILNCIFIGILSSTLFLNKYRKIRENIALSALSWFLLPSIWIGIIWEEHLVYLSYNQYDFGETLFVISNTIPFVIGLFYSFIKFRQRERK